jgi:RNA polymerase sigma-70 factor (ECF subfamily)
MEFYGFDQAYVDRLRSGDFRTQQHFVAYFTELMQIKLRSRVRRAEDVDDIIQDTFSRVLVALRSEQGIRQPDRLGPFVNSTCNNVLLEHYRRFSRNHPVESDEEPPVPVDPAPSPLDNLLSDEVKERVREVLDGLSERDRKLIREVLMGERNKDEICQELGVDRQYLRVLVHRAKKSFGDSYAH